MNNRQNGRRRGRGGVRPQGGGPRPDGGSRIDNRARGNAAQLHEKYRNLARDAQMQGDRVLTEYYFQFADHYFRILAENRPRFEEGDRQDQGRGRDQGRWDMRDDGPEGVEGAEGEPDERFGGERDQRPAPREAQRDPSREMPRERANGHEARPAPEPRGDTDGGFDAPAASAEDEGAPRRRRGRPRRDESAGREDAGERIEIDRLPPAVRAEPEAGERTNEEEPRRRRPRRPREDGPAVAAEA